MPVDQEFTFKELTQIALGGSTLTPYQLSILHYVINLLLQKADSTNETVKIGGFESKHLENLLVASKNTFPPIVPKPVESAVEKLNVLDELEAQITDMETKLESHFNVIRQKYKKSTHCQLFNWELWEHYDALCDDLCLVCEEKNKTACQLLKNKDFVKKLFIGISMPLVDRMIEYEQQIVQMHEELKEFIAWTESLKDKVECIAVLVQKIEELRWEINKNLEKFEASLREINEMLLTKLNKLHVSAIKKYVKDRIEIMQAALMSLKKGSNCPKLSGIFDTSRNICLSCNFPSDIKCIKPPKKLLNDSFDIEKVCKCKPSLSGIIGTALTDGNIKIERKSLVRFLGSNASKFSALKFSRNY